MITSKERPREGTNEVELEVVINNGDLQLIDSLVESYGFRDRNSLIKFGIAAILEGNNSEGIYTIKTSEEGKRVWSKINPSADLLVPSVQE